MSLFFLSLILVLFSSVTSHSNPAVVVAVRTVVPILARAIVNHLHIRKEAIKVLSVAGGVYVTNALRHKDGKTHINDMNCTINSVVDNGPTVYEIEQAFRKTNQYVDVWFSKREGKYNVYGMYYGHSKHNPYLVSIYCGGPNELDHDKIIVDATQAAKNLVQLANAGNASAYALIKDAIKAENPKLSDAEVEKIIKASANANEDTDTSNPDKEKDDKEPNQCKPCEPYPVGTIGYQGPETDKAPIPQLYEKRQHYHMFKVNQIPKTCECKWNHNNDFNHQYTAPIHYKWINLNSSPRRPPAYPH